MMVMMIMLVLVRESSNGKKEIEIDPLDAFMSLLCCLKSRKRKLTVLQRIRRIIQGEDSDSDGGTHENDDDIGQEDEDDNEFKVKKAKAERLQVVNHSKIQ